MKTSKTFQIGKQIMLLVVACFAMSAIWSVPYIFTLIAASFWMLLDHLVTEEDEDDFLFDWHNPSSTVRISWSGIGFRLLLICTLSFLAIQFPAIRSLGG